MSRRSATPKTAAKQFTERVLESVESLGATGQPIVAAISGGADSTALLMALHSLRQQNRIVLAAAHVNHALRGAESDGDERFVRELCERLEVPLICRRLPVALDAADRDEGIEATARRLRQQFFAGAGRELGAKFVATAHTADDQAETVLHRIVRGTGLAGLAGIPASRELAPGIKLIRPLLGLRRADVLDYLAAIGQDFREDCSNRDLRFTRNRVRHELLPYLAENFNPEVTEALVRLGQHATQAQTTICAVVERLRRRAVVRQDPNQLVLSVTPLRRSPRFVVCELVRQLWVEQSWPLQEIGQEVLDRITDTITLTKPHPAWDLPGGVRAERSRDRLILVQS